MEKKQITVVCAVVHREGKVLLNLRREAELPDAHMKWEFPGGKVEFDETPQEAIKREVLEETGIEVEVKKLLPYVATNYWEYPWGRQQTLCFIFLCNYVQEHDRQDDHHIEKVEWFTMDDAKKLDALPGTAEIIEIVQKELR
jgi:8-oxo-dGTP diphosphatase